MLRLMRQCAPLPRRPQILPVTMARLKIHVIGLLVDMLGMLAWFVALGGLSASMVQCVQVCNCLSLPPYEKKNIFTG